MKTTFTSSAAQLPRILTLGGIVFLLMGLFLSGSVQADVNELTTNQLNQTSHNWNTPGDWTTVLDRQGDNGYRFVHNGYTLRTTAGSSETFAPSHLYLGYDYNSDTDSYTVADSMVTLGLKNTADATITIQNLHLGNAQVAAWVIYTPTLAGNIIVDGNKSEIFSKDAKYFKISSSIVKGTHDACLNLVPFNNGDTGEIYFIGESEINCPLDLKNGKIFFDGNNTFGSDFALTLQDGTGIVMGANSVGTEGTTITIDGTARYVHKGGTAANKVNHSNVLIPEGSTLNAINNYDVGAKGSMVFAGELQGAGALVVDTVGTSNTNSLTLGHSENSFTGTVSVNTGKLQFTVKGQDNVTYTGTNALINAESVTVASGATIDVGATTQTFNILSGEGTITISEGGALTLNNNQMTLFTGSISGSGKGTVTKTGEGTLLINAAQGAVDVESLVVSSGRLDMKSYFKGDLEINNSATFSPGNSIGKLEQTGNFTLDSGATLLMEIGGTDAELNDQLIVSGTTTFEEGSIILFALDPESTYTPALGDTVLVTMPEVDWSKATFSSYQFTFQGYENGKVILGVNPNAVPEPSTWALLALGAAGLLYWRKRK